jgi:N-acetylmuramoyl-L-alanine amidase
MRTLIRRTAATIAATALGAAIIASSASGQDSGPATPQPTSTPTPQTTPAPLETAPAEPQSVPTTPQVTPSGQQATPTPQPASPLQQSAPLEQQPSTGSPTPAVPSAPAGQQPAPPASPQAAPPSGQNNTAFGQQEIDASRFIIIASPYAGGKSHQLLIIEQIKNDRPCWSELGGTPDIINPLLLNFNFAGICGRSIDSNSYSVRINGVDMAQQYRLRIMNMNQDLVLAADPYNCFQPDRTRCVSPPFVTVGRTNGLTSSYAKINLDPGWRLTRRTLNGRTLGHLYLTYEGVFPPAPIASTPPPSVPPTVQPGTLTFVDVGGDIYASEIQQAVQIGFIAGFENGTFRPQQTLTREQLVSMVLGALQKLPDVNLTIPATVAANPYSDVSASRWSAARIAFARDKNIVSGYQDGTFRPNQTVTRAEMIVVLEKAAEYARLLRGLNAAIPPQPGPPIAFSDISTHWAASTISEMSTYCKVASPENETGTAFNPNGDTRRNYAAAATLRMYNCVKSAQN